MTRGKFFLFLKEQVYSSIEFNGDMYFEGHGENAAKGMQQVKDVVSLFDFAIRFNRDNFGYPENGLTYCLEQWSYDEMLDMSKDYFKKYFSDYVFIKNMSGKPLTFIGKSGEWTYTLQNEKSGVLHFGEEAPDVFGELDAFVKKPKTKVLAIEDLDLGKEDIHFLIDNLGERDIVGLYRSWDELAREDAKEKGIIPAVNERYFDSSLYAEDMKKDGEEYLELPSGKVLLTRDIVD